MLIPSIKQLRSYLLPIIIILAGAALSAIAFHMTKEMDRQKIRMEFDQAAEARYVAFKREIESNLQVLVAIQAFYSVSKKEVQLAEFQVFTKPFLLQHKSIQALEWIPRIPDSEREVYERRARREGFPIFQITERKIQGEIVRAATRAEYFPVYYVEPYRGNEIALGFDLASNSTRKEALERSRDTGDILATARIILVQERTSQFGIIVFAPVYRKGAPADSVQKRHKNLEGFALGVFRIWDILEKSLTYLTPVSLDIYLYDRSAPEKESLLYYNPSRTGKTKSLPTDDREAGLETRLEYAKTLNVAGREWLVLCRATPDFIETRRSGWPSAVLTGGLLFTFLLAGYLLTYMRRTKRIEGLVNERTNELTERKRAEQALQMSETRYRRLFESAQDGILILDTVTGRVIDANPFMQELLGYSCEEFMGKSLWDIGSFKDIAVSKGYFEELQRKKYVRYEDLPLETSDGRHINVEFVNNVYMVDSRRVIQCNIRDITDRKQAEDKLKKKDQEIRDMTRQLWQATKLATVGEQAASIAHELNNPLATVSLRVESLLAKTQKESPIRRELEIIEREVERMGILIGNLLQFGRRGQQQISTLDVLEEIENTLELVYYHLQKNNIIIGREFEEDIPHIHADRQQLRQLFLNLFINASDAMPRSGTLTIRVTASPESGQVIIEVADTGTGIPTEILPKVMEPFYTTKPEGRGTGLGLAICRRIMQEHGGTFDLTSEGVPGKGTTARISLPVTSGMNAAKLT